MVGLASTTGKLISSTLLGSHTVLQKIGHVWIVYQNMAAVGHVRNESFGDKPPQAGIAQIQPSLLARRTAAVRLIKSLLLFFIGVSS